MTSGDRLAKKAADFLGTPFRLHGRNPRYGLDCLGLLECSLRGVGIAPQLPRGYRLRNSTIDQWLGYAALCSLNPASGPIEAGDVVLTAPSPGQHHIMIAEGATCFIHAHLGAKRVIRETKTLVAPPTNHWRLNSEI